VIGIRTADHSPVASHPESMGSLCSLKARTSGVFGTRILARSSKGRYCALTKSMSRALWGFGRGVRVRYWRRDCRWRTIHQATARDQCRTCRRYQQAQVALSLSIAPEIKFAADSVLEGDGFEPLVPLLGRAQLSRHARGGPLPSADSLRIQPSSSMRSAAMNASGWSSMTWCLASGTSTTGARGPIRDDM
jgi:hypothetical protein